MKQTIDSYICSLRTEERKTLEDLRRIIHSVSSFEETISFGMPAFRYNGKIVACFCIHENHIGFYPYSGSILKDMAAELKKFKTSIGGVQFQKCEKLPKTLIKKIIKARMKEINVKLKGQE